MSKQILQAQKNYKNIYLFSSLENYGKKRESNLKNIHFDDNDCIVVFNSPNLYVQKLLKDKIINYCFCRGFEIHQVKTKKVIENNVLDIANTEIIHEENSQVSNDFSKFISKFKSYNLRNGIYINNNKIDSCDYFKKMGYVYEIITRVNFIKMGYLPDKPKHYSPSMGFKAIIMLKLLYPDAQFYLIGFDNIQKKIIGTHNYKYELEYLKKSNIQHLYL